MELSKKIESLKPSMLNCNVFSVYDYPSSYTITELLCEFFKAINACIELCNKTIDLTEWLVNEGLEKEVAEKLDSWLKDGTLQDIINEKIFKELNEKLNETSKNSNYLINEFNSNKINIQYPPVGYEQYACVADANFKGEDGRWYKSACSMELATDNTNNIKELMRIAHREGKDLYVPKGRYALENPIVESIIGLEGENMIYTEFVYNGVSQIDKFFKITGANRLKMSNIQFNGDGKCRTCLDTSFDVVGPSLNNSYERVFCKGYTHIGWIGENNSDVWFNECLICEPGVDVSQTYACKFISPGGPIQFMNCNFLDTSIVAGQYIAFTDCVNRGIVVDGVGFNILHYTNGYLTQSPNTKLTIEIKEGSECGSIILTSPHIEIDKSGFLLGGSGKLHYGFNVTGGHIFDPENIHTGRLLSDTVNTTYTACNLKFVNTWFGGIIIPKKRFTDKGFIFEFERCMNDGVILRDWRIVGFPNTYTAIGDNEVQLCATKYDSGFRKYKIVVGNVNNSGVEVCDITNHGIYTVKLVGTTLDTPKSIITLPFVGGYGNDATPIMQAPGIASYADNKLNAKIENNKLIVFVEGSATIPQVYCYIEETSMGANKNE